VERDAGHCLSSALLLDHGALGSYSGPEVPIGAQNPVSGDLNGMGFYPVWRLYVQVLAGRGETCQYFKLQGAVVSAPKGR
jgi:hypothetical protein